MYYNIKKQKKPVWNYIVSMPYNKGEKEYIMEYYHGSIVPNLKTLYPFNVDNSLSQKECIYLTSKKEIALLYIWVRKFMWLTYGFDKQGSVVYTETHKDALKEFYNDVRGYIYSVNIDGDEDNDTKIKNVITMYKEIPVIKCEKVDDVYEKILEYENLGMMKIKRYEDLTADEILRSRKMILDELKSDLYKNDRPLLKYIQMTFPEIYEHFKKDR